MELSKKACTGTSSSPLKNVVKPGSDVPPKFMVVPSEQVVCDITKLRPLAEAEILRGVERPTDEIYLDLEGGNLTGGILILINTSIGSGLVATPYAFACLGLIYGFVWISLAAFLVGFSFHAMIQVALHLSLRRSSLSMANERTDNRVSASAAYAAAQLSPRTQALVNAAYIIQGWGVCISYLVLIGNDLPYVLAVICGLPVSSFSRPLCILVPLLVIIFPLCLFRNIGSLKFASVLAICSISYIVFLITFYFGLFVVYSDAEVPTDPAIYMDMITSFSSRTIEYWNAASLRSLFKALPIFVFGFTCHHNACKIYNEMAPRYKDYGSLLKMTAISIFTIFAIYSSVGILGYLTIGTDVSSDILESYDDPGSFFANILDDVDPYRISLLLGRIALLALVMTCFAIQLHPTRDTIILVVSKLHASFSAFLRARNQRFAPIAMEQDHDILLESDLAGRDEDGAEDDLERKLLPTIEAGSREIQLAASSADVHNLRLHVLVTIVFCAMSFVVACSVTDFSRVLSFVGATGSNLIALFFGPYFYFHILPSYNIPKVLCAFTIACSFVLFLGVFYCELVP